MKFLRTHVLVAVIALGGIFRLGSIFDAHNLRDLWSVFNPKYQRLSPMQGALCYSTKFLERFYPWGPTQWPTHCFFRDLFNALPEGTVRLSQLPSNWVRGLDGELVGRIVVWLEKGAAESEGALLSEEWYTKYKATGQKSKVKHVEGVRRLALIRQSYEFDPLVTCALLTSVLYLKDEVEGVHSKQKMIDYIRVLRDGLGSEPFVQPLTDEMLDNMVLSHYSDADLAMGGVSVESIMVSGLLKIGKDVFSPHIIQRSYEFNGQALRPNCAETALMDFFCILFFDPSTKTFTFNSLPAQIQGSLNERLRSFFTKNNNADGVNKQGVQQEWMNAVSGIDGLKSDAYVTGTPEMGRYEVESNVANLLVFVNYLLGTSAADWDQLGTLLSTSELTVTCQVKKINEGESIIVISHSKCGLIELHVENNRHTFISYPIRDENIVSHAFQAPVLPQNNNHSFYIHGLEDRNNGLRVLEDMFEYFRTKVVSLEGIIHMCDIAFALIKNGYLGDDSYFYQKIFELVVRNGPEDQELFIHLMDAVFESKKISPFVLLDSMHTLYKNPDLYKTFSTMIVNKLPKDMLKKREDGSSLFCDYMKNRKYRVALLLANVGSDMSCDANREAAIFMLDKFIAVSVDDLMGLLSLDCVDKNAVEFTGRSLWYAFCSNIMHWYAYPQVAEYMLDATAKGIITTMNEIETRQNKTALDVLIKEKKELFISVYLKYITEAQAKLINNYIDDLMIKMKALGAKTAQELGRDRRRNTDDELIMFRENGV